MKRNGILIVLLLVCMLALFCATGCGNVYLKGEAMTASQQSTMDAYQAFQRVNCDPTVADWQKAYLCENFKQWRFFVRSANKDPNWGPKLPNELPTTQPR